MKIAKCLTKWKRRDVFPPFDVVRVKNFFSSVFPVFPLSQWLEISLMPTALEVN